MDNFTENSLIIFCDGACSGNPGPGGWAAIIATPEGKILELGGYLALTTNNQMELTAALEALRAVEKVAGKINLYTDSVYVIRGITQWIWGWKKRGWLTAEGNDVANRELWHQLSEQVAKRGKENPIEWHYVRGHSEIPGNERVDEIAVAFSKRKKPKLYSGPLLKYDIPIHDLPDDTSVPEKSLKPKNKTQAHSYLSLIGGDPMRHKTWPECERRVKGQSGAKFKKTISAEDEIKILKSWGVDPKKIFGKD